MASQITRTRISDREFIALAALMLSLVAMSIDAMLPALDEIGRDFGVKSANDTQFVVSALFLGLAIAQMFFGPLSDGWGRKPAIYLGLSIFIVGSCVAMVSERFEVLILGRVLQGIGAAGPKVVAVAAIRDKFRGAAMGKIMSAVMAVFILVPAIAPALGQFVLNFSNWKGIFAVLLAHAALTFAWFAVRQPETLPLEKRLSFSWARISEAIVETVRNRTALGYTIAAGLTFGGLLGYLNSAQ